MARNKFDNSFKYRIIKEFEKGKSQSDIARKHKINRSIVCRLIKKYRLTGAVETVNLGGRPRKTSWLTDRKILAAFRKDPFATSKDVVRQLNLPIHESNVRRRAIQNNLKSYRPAKKPMLTKKHLEKRLHFARTHLNWTVEKWQTVLFSDESKFNLVNSDGMCTVRRGRGERLNPRYSTATVKHGGGSVMIWACFSGGGVGPIHEVNGIMDRFMYRDILQNRMLPFAEWNMPLRWLFQHDNDPKHTAKVVSEWLSVNKIQALQWPSQSPDLNPIENLFGIIKRRLGKNRFKNKTELFAAIKSEWKNMPKSIISNVIASMPRRCAKVIQNNGYHTKY